MRGRFHGSFDGYEENREKRDVVEDPVHLIRNPLFVGIRITNFTFLLLHDTIHRVKNENYCHDATSIAIDLIKIVPFLSTRGNE